MAVPDDIFKSSQWPARRYDEVRTEVRSGDILLCSGRAVFSNLIQKATKSPWSHVAFVMRLDAIDRVMVLESVESMGVRTVPLRNYVRDYAGKGKGYNGGLLIARDRRFPSPAEGEAGLSGPLANLSKRAVDLFGYPYDSDEIAKIAWKIATGGRFSTGKLRTDKEYICSEYVYTCFQSLGLDIDHDPKGFIAPSDFARNPEIAPVVVLQTEGGRRR
jgi:hypothetical protein